MRELENNDQDNFYVVAFRGSGKSTIVTTAYPIWAILGQQQKKFITIYCQTQTQAKLHLTNIRRELEDNVLLKNDLGPFKEQNEEWGATTLVFANHNARIVVASTEQSVRGMRHLENRPDLIICDDIEDLASTKTRESRNKTYQWLRGDVIPSGDKGTRLIIVGNLLHEDSLLMRIEEDVENKLANGKFARYPLLDDENVCIWPGKYRTDEDVEAEHLKIGNEISWQREYLLNIVPDDDKVIHRDWIQYYDVLPNGNPRSIRVGVDLAISQKMTADYTAMVTGLVYDLPGKENNPHIYILPNPDNERLTFPDTFERCVYLNSFYTKKWSRPMFAIESVAYQQALPQQLETRGIQVAAIRPTQDKRSRLALTSHLIKSGQVMFPIKGCEKLISQLVNFGVEKHDDLADAFSYTVLSVIDNPPQTVGLFWFSKDPDGSTRSGGEFF